MRWKDRTHNLDRRIVRRFLLIPRYIKGEHRWLEIGYMIQKRVTGAWCDRAWTTKEKYLAWREEVGYKEKETQ